MWQMQHILLTFALTLVQGAQQSLLDGSLLGPPAINLTVKRGGTLYLTPANLGIERIPPGETWKIQVVDEEPMFQRVGMVSPQIFDGNFPEHTVKYSHSGSPLMSTDQIKFSIHRFVNNQSETKLVVLPIKVTEAEYKIFVTDNNLKPLEVGDYYGLSNPLDSTVLRFRYNYYNGASCTISYRRTEWGFPIAGKLVRGPEQKSVDNLSHDCREFIYMGYQYKHQAPPTPNLDYIPFVIEAYDPSYGFKENPIIEEVYLPVHINNALQNLQPDLEIKENYKVEVRGLSFVTLDPDSIQASDEETPKEWLVFNITGLPSEGYFVNMFDPTMPISSFLQKDLINHAIAYHPVKMHTNEEKSIKAIFKVFDSEYATSDPGVLEIHLNFAYSKAPVIVKNSALVIIEGESLPITKENLHITDEDNLEDVRINVKSGLRHGMLKVNGTQATSFTPMDIDKGLVVYHHDDSDSKEDKIVMRINDRSSTIRIKFHIKIIPKDDSAPYLINNAGAQVSYGRTVQFTHKMLSAHDKDTLDQDIIYTIKSFPQAGRVVKKFSPMGQGNMWIEFKQEDIDQGFMYYEHAGRENYYTDSFEIQLKDNQDPPNKSGKYRVHVHINPVSDILPHQLAGTTRQLMVEETDVAFILKDHLQYTDTESSADDLLYTITSQPFYPASTITIDAGRVILVHNYTKANLHKNSMVPSVRGFYQSDINNGKVAYMPPMEDVGPIRRHARFVFNVRDSTGNEVTNQPFDITILPVNNQVPHFNIRPIRVAEGGTISLSTDDISIYDPDTDPENLIITLKEEPLYGRILKNDIHMTANEEITMAELGKSVLKYEHDGTDIEQDVLVLTGSDGINEVTEEVLIDIDIKDDEAPQPLQDLRNKIVVYEGGQSTISTANLGATDNDTDDFALTFFLLQPPQFGTITVKGKDEKEFTQGSLMAGHVKYVHSGEEIGMYEKYDTASFAVTDRQAHSHINALIMDLNITLLPVNNVPPETIISSVLFVTEGQSATINHEVLSAQDVDTSAEKLIFIITKQPGWGYVVVSPSSPKYDGTNKQLSEFTMGEVIQGDIVYIQANNSKVEPMSDTFEVYVTDGKFISSPSAVQITILPDNDEAPVFRLEDIVLYEGQERILDHDILFAMDMDVPNQKLVLSVDEPPSHGKLSLMMKSLAPSEIYEIPMHDVTLKDIQNDMRLMYKHDGSEHFQDQFTLQITDGKHIVKKTSMVKIVPTNDERPAVIKNTGIQINYKDKVFITGDFLKTVDMDTKDTDIIYMLIAEPEKGVLQMLDATKDFYVNDEAADDENGDINQSGWIKLKAGMNFTQDDLEGSRIRYIQNSPEIKETETDKFVFKITDKVYSLPNDMFEIEILNPALEQLVLLSKGTEVKSGDSHVITTSELSASDGGSSRPQDIVFHITRPPIRGHIGIITEKHKKISNFTQLDLMAQKVFYQHSGKPTDTDDSFDFTAVNNFKFSRSGTFFIEISQLDQILPTLDTNVPLTVVQGAEALLTTYNLHIHDPDTNSHNLTYLILEPPRFGQLLFKGLPMEKKGFSQYDIDNSFVTYESEESDEAGIDYFLFTISDGRHDGYLINGSLETKPAFFNILVQPLSKEPPKLVNKKSPAMLETFGQGKFGFLLDSNHLRAVHPMSESSQLVYSVLEKPLHGYLEHMDSGKMLKKRFTQEDLNKGKIQYILNSDTLNAVNDSILFRIQDNNRNTLDNQRLDLYWSVIEFIQSQYIVCENAGTINISLKREGGLNTPAFVDVKVRPMSAKETVDYIPTPDSQIRFEPGVSEVIAQVRVVEDNQDEPNEKFKMVLKTPINAVVGVTDKATIQIVNLENGRCADYIGMISKDTHKGRGPSPLFAGKPKHDTHPDEILVTGEGENEDDFNPFEAGLLNKGSDRTPHDRFETNEKIKEFLDREVNKGYGNRKNTNKGQENEPVQKKKSSKRKKKNRKSKNRDMENRGKTSSRSGKGKPKNKKQTSGGATEVDTLPDQFAPQPCVRETQGLLYFDLRSARMYKCNRGHWEKWERTFVNTRMYKTEPVQSQSLVQREPARTRECSPGWKLYRDGCYKSMEGKDIWNDAEWRCKMDYGGHLAHVLSENHMQWLSKMVDHSAFWIGLNDKTSNHRWRYTSDEPVRYFNWKKGFPKFQPSLSKNCVLVTANMDWANRVCDKNPARYICVKPKNDKDGKRRRRFSFKNLKL